MAIEDFAAEPATAATARTQVRFSRPLRFVVRAVLFLALIGFLGYILQAGLIQAFMTNPGLNGLILGALFVGCLIALRELWRIHSEARAATSLAADPASADVRRGQVIAPMGSVLPALERGTLAPAQAVSVLESIAVRLDDGREVLRYLSGLLVFLGLLGTFWGLLDTVGSVGGVIKSLRTGAEAGVLFDELKAGLSAPLAGMGLSFSSSLFGIAMADGASNNRAATQALSNLAEGIQGLVQHMRSEQQMIRDWVEAQAAREKDMKRLIDRLTADQITEP